MNVTAYYDSNAHALARTYESLEAAKLHSWLTEFLPTAPACVLDIGAGSGRDAVWLTSKGYDVVAVEPSSAMVKEARLYHQGAAIQWIEGDALPDLQQTIRIGKAYDFIMLSAVWMHVPVADRARAFRKIISLMKPGARVAMTLRHGPSAAGQLCYDVSQSEIEGLCREHGAYVERVLTNVSDVAGRTEISWTQMVIRLPDDGTGALPLIRQIILNDSKDSTYKLALLRTLCRIAEGAAGYARSVGDDQTSVPLGLVGLYWLRLYIPLLQQGLPQRANNRGLANLGFVKEAYRSLADIAARELRVGMTFASRGEVLRSALSDAITTIKDMPVTFITYADGRAIFGVLRRRVSPTSTKVRLDEAFLSSFGEFLIPTSLWLALQRYTAWIEPAIEAEWGRLMLRYSAGQGKTEAELKSVREVISTAMSWPESTREVKLARAQALSLLSREPLKCVWSGRYLTAESLHIDHCLPFALWPCDDLWNLLPTHQRENGRKSDRVPSADLLRRQRDQILGWWDKAYCTGSHTSLHEQFTMEARATLPGIGRSICGNDDIFSGLILQQMRLRHDQQAPLWDGPR